MSRNTVALAILSSAYNEDFVVTSIKKPINNLEMIDNVILNNLANQNMAPCQLIKKRAENKNLLNSSSSSQLKFHRFAHSGNGHLQTFKPDQVCSEHSQTQSAQFQSFNDSANKTNLKSFVNKQSGYENESESNVKGFKGDIPADFKTLQPRGRKKNKPMARFFR